MPSFCRRHLELPPVWQLLQNVAQCRLQADLPCRVLWLSQSGKYYLQHLYLQKIRGLLQMPYICFRPLPDIRLLQAYKFFPDRLACRLQDIRQIPADLPEESDRILQSDQTSAYWKNRCLRPAPTVLRSVCRSFQSYKSGCQTELPYKYRSRSVSLLQNWYEYRRRCRMRNPHLPHNASYP